MYNNYRERNDELESQPNINLKEACFYKSLAENQNWLLQAMTRLGLAVVIVIPFIYILNKRWIAETKIAALTLLFALVSPLINAFINWKTPQQRFQEQLRQDKAEM